MYRSSIHDNIQGTGFWPKVYDGRAIIGESYKDHLAGLSEEENIAKYKSAFAAGESTRRTVWAYVTVFFSYVVGSPAGILLIEQL